MMRGAAKRPENVKPRGVDEHLEDRAVQDLGRRRRPSTSSCLGQEHRAALLDLLDALVALHRLDAHRVGHHQERPEQPLLGSPQPADLAAHTLRPALALPDEAKDEQERDEQQNDQKQDQENLNAGLRRTRPIRSSRSMVGDLGSTPRRQRSLTAALGEVAAPRRGERCPQWVRSEGRGRLIAGSVAGAAGVRTSPSAGPWSASRPW